MNASFVQTKKGCVALFFAFAQCLCGTIYRGRKIKSVRQIRDWFVASNHLRSCNSTMARPERYPNLRIVPKSSSLQQWRRTLWFLLLCAVLFCLSSWCFIMEAPVKATNASTMRWWPSILLPQQIWALLGRVYPPNMVGIWEHNLYCHHFEFPPLILSDLKFLLVTTEKRQTWNPIRLRAFYNLTLTTAQATFLQNTLMPAAIAWLQSALSVVPASQPIVVPVSVQPTPQPYIYCISQ